jgi:hypothetical protein
MLHESHGTIRKADARRVDGLFVIDALELKPRMKWIPLEVPKCRSRLSLNTIR